MAVFLTVLKIIGIILLSILGLVLLLLIIVLFAPIGYDSDGRYDDSDKDGLLINVHAHWLLRIIRFRFTLKGKEKVINYSNGVKIADTGIPELDKAFAEVFHDQTFKQESARYEDRVFQIMLSPGDDGVVTFYWHLE